MWALRVLNGPMTGKIFPLKAGKNQIGRNPENAIAINVQGVSKVHAEINVLSDKILLSDLQSSNGTFLNGVRVKGGILKIGDKISIYNVLCDVVLAQERPSQVPLLAQPGSSPAPMPMEQPPMEQIPEGTALPKVQIDLNVYWGRMHQYIETVLLPGIYRMGETFEFRQLMMGFVAIFVLLMTFLSIIPMKRITAESISFESQRRAMTVARALAQSNERVLRSGDVSAFSTDLILREEGIEDVYIISKEGTIIAPPDRIGSNPKDVGFVNQVKIQARELSAEVGGRVAAAVPILSYDPELQQNIAKAYAIVVYNPGSLAFDDGRAFSLFVQMLAIALVLGFVLFYLLYKLVEHPFVRLHKELDSALREGRDNVQVNFRFSSFQNLLTTLNSILVRALSANASQQKPMAISKEPELSNVLDLVGFPGILLDASQRVVKVNSPFESLTGIASLQVAGQNLTQLPDQAMQKNIEGLILTSQGSPDHIATDKLELSGNLFKLSCQCLRSQVGEIEFYLITISPYEGTEGQAA